MLAVLVCAYRAEADPRRDVLWMAVKTCVLAKRTTGDAYPCLAVDLAATGQTGTAVLRAPGARTHIVVMPTDTVAGLETRDLRSARGVAYWRAALAARHYVSDALPGRSIGDVGLAINSASGRSQDQLHIHLDCVKPSVRAAIERYERKIDDRWQPFPAVLLGDHYVAKRVASSDDDFNPFVALSLLPGSRKDLRDVSLAAVRVPDGSFILLASEGTYVTAEDLLDHTCDRARNAD